MMITMLAIKTWYITLWDGLDQVGITTCHGSKCEAMKAAETYAKESGITYTAIRVY